MPSIAYCCPTLEILVRGREDAVLAAQPDDALQERIEELASKCTEGELTPEERKGGNEAYVRAGQIRGDRRAHRQVDLKAGVTL